LSVLHFSEWLAQAARSNAQSEAELLQANQEIVRLRRRLEQERRDRRMGEGRGGEKEERG